MKRKRLCPKIVVFAIALALFAGQTTSYAQTDKIFRTKYTIVHYQDDKEINDFLWRIGGTRVEFREDMGLASSRIDRVVERVATILGMWVRNLNLHIYLHSQPLEANKTAYYDIKTAAIHVYVENASDGVFAHEVAHAVINKYFVSPPPSQVQEILTRYVDKYLWNDY